jgi:hypothetical protein
MSRTALIDNTGKVVDVIIAGAGYTPPAGYTAEPSETANINDTFSNGAFVSAVPIAPIANQLTIYATVKLGRIVNGGITVNVGTSQSPINVLADTTAEGRANLNGILQGYALGVLTGNFTWYQSSGSLSLTQAQLQQVATAVMQFIASAYAAWQAVTAAIAAGTITTKDAVDAQSWPVNS